MSCEEARQKVNEYIKENDLPVGEEQINEAVKACCADWKSQDCVDALSTLAATVACTVYTKGVCIPCCEAIGGVVGSIVGKGIAVAVGLLKGVVEFVTDLFGGGGCDFDGAAAEISAGYSQATREIAVALEQAWNQARADLELPPKPQPLWCKKGPGGRWFPMADIPDDVKSCMGSIANSDDFLIPLIRNTAILSYASEAHGARTWTVKGKPGFLIMPAADPAKQQESPENLFYFWWDSWQCSQPNNWKKAALDVCALRFSFVQRAAELMAQDMATNLSREVKYRNKADLAMQIATKLNLAGVGIETIRLQPTVAPKSESKSRPVVAVGILGAVLGGGYLAWRFWPRTT